MKKNIEYNAPAITASVNLQSCQVICLSGITDYEYKTGTLGW